MLSPFGAVMEALATARLARLDDVQKDIRNSLAQVKFGAGGLGGGAQRLHPEDYMRLFDPGFVQVVALDSQNKRTTVRLANQRYGVAVADNAFSYTDPRRNAPGRR